MAIIMIIMKVMLLVQESNRIVMPGSQRIIPTTTTTKRTHRPNEDSNGKINYPHSNPSTNNMAHSKYHHPNTAKNINHCNHGSYVSGRNISSSRGDGRVCWMRNRSRLWRGWVMIGGLVVGGVGGVVLV